MCIRDRGKNVPLADCYAAAGPARCREALGEVAPRIADFAEREGLHAHARSVTIRYEK